MGDNEDLGTMHNGAKMQFASILASNQANPHPNLLQSIGSIYGYIEVKIFRTIRSHSYLKTIVTLL